MSKFKIIILIVVVVTLPFILIGVLSFIKNRSNPSQSPIQSIPTTTPTPKTSNIDEFKTISGRIVEIDPEFIILNINGQTQSFEFDRDIDITRFKVDQVVTLVLSKEDEKAVMEIIKR